MGSILLRRYFFPVEGIFPLELAWVLTTPPPPPPQKIKIKKKPSSDECIYRGLVCAHMQSVARNACPRRVKCQQQKHTQHAPSTKPEFDYLNGWIKNGHIRKNLTHNGEPHRYRWGMQKKKKKTKDFESLVLILLLAHELGGRLKSKAKILPLFSFRH